MDSDKKGGHKEAAMWFVRSMKKKARKVLSAHLPLEVRSSHGRIKEGSLTPYVQVVNHYLKTYITDDIVAGDNT